MESNIRASQTNTTCVDLVCTNRQTDKKDVKVDLADQLPVELIAGHILAHLGPSDLVAFALTCRRYKQITQFNCVWASLFTRTFNLSIELETIDKALYLKSLENSLTNSLPCLKSHTDLRVLYFGSDPEFPADLADLSKYDLTDEELAKKFNVNILTNEGQKLLNKIKKNELKLT